MKQVFAYHGRAVVFDDVPEPELRPGEILVETAFTAISSGTELHAIHSTARPETTGAETYPSLTPSQKPTPRIRNSGTRWDRPVPRPPHHERIRIGYSLAGTVLAVSPEVTDMRIGDRVACSGNQCASHAERVAVPRNLAVKVPDGVSLEQASFVTLGSIALNALRRANCQLGETVVVHGLGLLGQLAVQICRAGGLQVLGIDVDDRRVGQATALGAHRAINPRTADAVATVLEMTDGFGADAVLLFVVTDSSEPLNLSFDMCRQRGCVVGVGLFGMTIDRGRMYANDVAFYPALAYGPGRYDPVYEEGGVDYPVGYVRWTENRNQSAFLRLIADGKVQVEPLAPIKVPLDQAPRAYELLQSPDRPPTVVLTYR